MRYGWPVAWVRDPKIPDLVSMTEAAEMLGISRQAMRKRAERGQIAGAQIGEAGVWVFRRALVKEVAERDGIAADLA